MSPPRLIRDAGKVLPYLKELPNGQLFTTRACKIQIPKRFAQRGLAQIGIDTYTYGLFALITDEGFYAVSNINAMMKIEPFKTLSTVINDVEYDEFYFEANQTLLTTTQLVKRDVLIYNVLDEFIFKGNIPWYTEYDDLGKIFDTALSHAGSNIAQNYEVIELIASILARNPNDRTKYYRTVIEQFSDLSTNPPDYVPMNSVFYSATNTLNKIAGSYFNDGVVSALVEPTNSVSRIEQLLRA